VLTDCRYVNPHYWGLSAEMGLWYAEVEMMVLGFIGLGVLLLLLVLAKGETRFNIGPQWLRRFTIDSHTLY
jgi:hypothetical protein